MSVSLINSMGSIERMVRKKMITLKRKHTDVHRRLRQQPSVVQSLAWPDLCVPASWLQHGHHRELTVFISGAKQETSVRQLPRPITYWCRYHSRTFRVEGENPLTIRDNGIKHSSIDLSPRRMTNIRHNRAQNASCESILFRIGVNTCSTLSSDLSSINITAHGHGTEMCTSHQKAAGAHKRIINEFARSTQGLIGHDQRQFCIHGRVANVSPFLDIELFDQIALSVPDLQLRIKCLPVE